MHQTEEPIMPVADLSLHRKILLSLLLALVLWLPRGLALDHFVAVDERSWLTRSGNFFLALHNRNFAHTFQRYHPGVVTMWAGAAGFLWRYPDYAGDANRGPSAGQITSMSEGIEDFLRTHNHPPLEMLAAGRTVMVLLQVLLLLIAFWLAVDLAGPLAALMGLLLIAFEPFVLGLTRMLHVDGMSSTLMFVSVLALLHHQLHRPHKRTLILSGILAGLAWLTKSPALFLAPFAVLVITAAWLQDLPSRKLEASWKVLAPWITPITLWSAAAVAVFVALWPAMWVDPIGSVSAMLNAAGESAAEGHSKELYFAGQAYDGDPGPTFYPITYLWRTTPVTLLGLLLALGAGMFGLSVWKATSQISSVEEANDEANEETLRKIRVTTAIWLTLYILLFLLFMTLGAKKFPRYLLPVYYPINLLAGLGFAALADWISRRTRRRWVLVLALTAPIAVQAGLALPHFPYYLTYYNPLLGGAQRAPQVMMIGLGEGLDEAARYLLQKPDAATLTVASWYRGGSFNYIFPYRSVDIEAFYLADYAVIYAHQWQRRVPNDRLLAYFAGLTPEQTITLHGIDYAHIYDLRSAPPAPYFTDWGPSSPAIRLVRTDLPQEAIQPGAPFVVRLHFLTVDTIAINLNVVVRLLDESGDEVARSEGWPFGSPTSTWEPGQIYIDGHEFTLSTAQIAANQNGYFRIEVGFYDPTTLEMLTPTVAGTETPRAEFLPVGYLWSGAYPPIPAQSFAPPIQLGAHFSLRGMALVSESLDTGARSAPVMVSPGANLSLSLYWSATRATNTDYTVLLHFTDAGGAPLAQWDRQPVAGLVPTSLWKTDDVIVDRYQLVLPADLPPGEYQLITGLYDLATLDRLAVQRAGVPAGNTVSLATFIIDGS